MYKHCIYIKIGIYIINSSAIKCSEKVECHHSQYIQSAFTAYPSDPFFCAFNCFAMLAAYTVCHWPNSDTNDNAAIGIASDHVAHRIHRFAGCSFHF